MDAFKNYNNLISGLNQANQFKDEGVRAVAETKAKADEIGKSLGEVKSFLAGTHGSKAFVKDYVKPKLKARAERLAERAKKAIKDKVEGKVNEVRDRINNARQNAQDRLDQARENVEDRLNNEPNSSLDQPNTQGENHLQNEQQEPNEEYDDWDTPYGGETNGGEQNDGYDDWDTPFEGESRGGYDEWDTPWGGDTLEEGRAGTFSNPIANTRANLQNPVVQDSQNPMVSRPSELPSYSESTDDVVGTKLYKVTVTKGDQQGVGYMFGREPPPPKYNATGGEGGDALSGESQMSNVSAGATGAGNAGSQTEQVAKQSLDKGIAKTAEKTVAKTAGEDVAEAGGEATLGVLDAIPGLDILGFIGGAILTAVEAHKQRKEEREEEEGAGATPTQAVQVGVGGE